MLATSAHAAELTRFLSDHIQLKEEGLRRRPMAFEDPRTAATLQEV
jgi:hypothetical protein